MDKPSDPASPPSALGAPGRRRNGRLQACEPCRKRKVSCDHGVPICRRCKARNNAGDCVYLAPEQKTPGGGRKPTPRRVSTVGEEGGTSTGSSPRPQHNGLASSIATRRDSPDSRGLPPETSPGYLGFTSFEDVYRETQNSLSLVQGATILSNMRAPGSSAPEASRTTVNLTPTTLETCLTVLRRIPGQDVSVSLYKKHRNPNDGWIRLAGQRLAESLPKAFGRELRSRKATDLEAMAQVISANTARPWPEDQPDGERWLASFSGHSIRWECVGILFTYWALGALAGQHHRPEPGRLEEVDPRRMTLAYKDAAQLCIDLCEGCEPNSLLLYLMYKVAILESMVSGDASPSFWRKYGEVVATATYIGLHAMPQDGTYAPSASSEARRRLISQIFVVDKVAASFAGRPPLLSRKYLLTPQPLDLGDDVLLSDAASIAREVERLDERGWNHDGKFYSTTIVRARRSLMVVKDEVMELALGYPISASMESLLDLKTRELALLADLPDALRYHPEDVRDLTVPGPTLYTKLLVHLEHLQNFFLINRMLVQRGHDSNAALLSISFQMVATTLVFWTHMDRLASLQGDFEWLVMAYAAPAGGILCNELLKPMPNPTPAPDVTKSGIIQQLSLLAAFLDWVSPGAPNGDLCRSCKAVIQHVLDQALNGVPTNPADGARGDHGFDFNTDFGADMYGFFNFDLLDTFDWLRPEMPSSQQSHQIT